jgi:CubicO group peptidase (beta-lactamase class C family)
MLDAAYWTTRLAELIRQARVPGAALGIWADGQEILAASGVLNRVTGVRTSTDSVFQVGSITKVWTATMIMQLIDEDLLSLDTTVAQALPGVRLGAADLGDRVTVAHLLTHTSGIDGDIFTDTGRGDDCVERYVGLLSRARSAFPPGAAYSYCNSGWVVLGRIIEVLDGRSWDESLRQRLCGPLELAKTVTLPEEAILYRAAVGHRAGGARVQVWGLPRSVGPAGLITATAHDLLTFTRFHLDRGLAPDGKRLLSEASVAAMQEPRAVIPDFSTPGAAIGLGWRVYRWGGHTILGHDGDTVGQSAYLRVDPRTRVAACLLTNSGQTTALKQAVFTEVFETLVGVRVPPHPRPVAAGELDLGRYVGRYERSSRRFDVSVRDGRLYLLLTATGELATLGQSQPEELTLYPADSSGVNFVCRSYDHEPWAPVTFGQLADGCPYLFAGGRLTPRTGLSRGISGWARWPGSPGRLPSPPRGSPVRCSRRDIQRPRSRSAGWPRPTPGTPGSWWPDSWCWADARWRSARPCTTPSAAAAVLAGAAAAAAAGRGRRRGSSRAPGCSPSRPACCAATGCCSRRAASRGITTRTT